MGKKVAGTRIGLFSKLIIKHLAEFITLRLKKKDWLTIGDIVQHVVCAVLSFARRESGPPSPWLCIKTRTICWRLDGKKGGRISGPQR
jgi:hypothetical protein